MRCQSATAVFLLAVDGGKNPFLDVQGSVGFRAAR